MAQSLRKLVLSHNRIVTIQPLGTPLGFSPALEYLDLNDNFIGDLEQIKCLQHLTNLREVLFEADHGTNPMCDFENYVEAVRLYLPQLTKLDQKDLIPGYKTPTLSRISLKE